MIESLYQYNDWANGRLFQLAEGLADEQLDSPLEMGLGSLRATLFHMLAAEQIWLERWQLKPWRTFPLNSEGVSLEAIAAGLRAASEKHWEIIDGGRENKWSDSITYKDWKQNEHSNRLIDMLVHVANHGVHHRAQALYMLKQFGRKVTGGLDYLFFRIAYPTTPLFADHVDSMRQYGMEVDSGVGEQVQFQKAQISDYFSYHDWANKTLLELASSLPVEALHRDFKMGVGSIHKTIAHLRDAERWWLGNWRGSEEVFPKHSAEESVEHFLDSWHEIADQRNSVVESLDQETAQRVVVANPGRIKIPVRVIESMIQLCCHGTHHRAQLVNMLRQSGVRAPEIDYIVWQRLRQAAEAATKTVC